jgi:hypothetical protein
MRVLLSTYGLREDAEPMLGLAVQLRALGAEGCDALVATRVTPAQAHIHIYEPTRHAHKS